MQNLVVISFFVAVILGTLSLIVIALSKILCEIVPLIQRRKLSNKKKEMNYLYLGELEYSKFMKDNKKKCIIFNYHKSRMDSNNFIRRIFDSYAFKMWTKGIYSDDCFIYDMPHHNLYNYDYKDSKFVLVPSMVENNSLFFQNYNEETKVYDDVDMGKIITPKEKFYIQDYIIWRV